MEQNKKTDKLLEVRDLQVSFFTPAGEVKAVNGISYDLNYNEVMGVVGESGSGKSMVVHCIMGLRKRDQVIDSGSVTFDGKELFSLTAEEMRGLQGQDMSIVFQEPMTSLNPVYRIKDQIMENILTHEKVSSGAEGESHPGHEGCGASQCGGTVSLLSS